MTKDEVIKKLSEIGIYNVNEFGIEISENPKHLKIEFEVWLETDVFGNDCENLKKFLKKESSIDWNYIENKTSIKNGRLVFLYENNERIENFKQESKLTIIEDDKISNTIFLSVTEFAIEQFLNRIYNNI